MRLRPLFLASALSSSMSLIVFLCMRAYSSEGVTRPPSTNRDVDHAANCVGGVKPARQRRLDEHAASKRRPRVFCIILSQASHLATNAAAVNQTWAAHCNAWVFVLSRIMTGLKGHSGRRANGYLPLLETNIPEGRKHLWEKVKFAFKYVYVNFLDHFDYYLKADDDTYVIVDNLRRLLRESHLPPSQAWWSGRQFRMGPARQRYMSGGAGYVLSRGAVKRLVEEALLGSGWDSPSSAAVRCRGAENFLSEDVNMGACLESIGAIVVDSVDSSGSERFHPLSYASHFNFKVWPKDFWLWRYNWHSIRFGQLCCSNKSISFHYMSPLDMYTFHFLLFRLKKISAETSTN